MTNYLLPASILIAALALTAVGQRPAAQATPTPRAATPPATTATAPPTQISNAPLPVSKMAVIYTEAFLDPKSGILKFTTLLNKLNSEFQKQKDDLQAMTKNVQTLEAEIDKLRNAPSGTPIDQRTVQAKQDQVDQLKRDITRKGEDAQGAYSKRRDQLFAPLQDEIGKALAVFAKSRNITVIFDGSQVPLIYAASNTDITQAFIADFNSKNPVTAATTPPQ